jgi:hybrid cluster-associated redox disulfide protein
MFVGKFTKDMTIEEALELNPKAREVFAKFGMGCFVCSGALMETIEEGAQAHGIDVEQLVKELNKLIGEN